MKLQMMGFVLPGLIALHGVGCNGSSGEDLCHDVNCLYPPASVCLDQHTLTVYEEVGHCLPATGTCEYGDSQVECDAGCQDGQCMDGPCSGKTCDDPPADICKDQNLLLDYPETGVCDPESGQCGYTPEEVACPNGCQADRCQDPDSGDDFGIQVPQDTLLCSLRTNRDLPGALMQKARIGFRPGLIRLPREQDSFEADWIERLELGPDRRSPSAVGPGVVNVLVQGDPETEASWRYEYYQQFDDAGQMIWLTVEATYQVESGSCERPVISVDDQDFLYERCYLEPVVTLYHNQDNVVGFGSCQFDNDQLYTSQQVEIDMVNGDQLRFEARMSTKCCCYFGADLAELVQGEFERNAQILAVTDFFQLAIRTHHHIFGQSYLVLLDPPVEEVHGVLVVESDYPDPQVQYLDADLDPVDTPEVEDVRVVTYQ